MAVIWGLILTVGAGIVGAMLDYYDAANDTARYICAAAVLIGFMLMAVISH
jgi:hypothetical protein